jgi:FkbM family methyltransferase
MKPINIFRTVVSDWLETVGRPLSFVQIGAHDGLHLDPIRPLVEKYHWAGLLIEPQPDIFERLKLNYAGEKQLSFLNVAASNQDGTLILHRLKPGQGFHDHSTMLASSNRWLVENNGHGYRGQIEELAVKAFGPYSLADMYPGIVSTDILQVDTEGHDPQILLAWLNAALTPPIIQFESALKTDGYDQLIAVLDEKGYRRAEVGINMVCYLQKDDGHFDNEQANKGYTE